MKQKTKDTIKNDKKSFVKFIIFGIVLLIIVAITIKLLPWIISLKDQAARDQLRDYIHSFGIWGWLVALGIQILQVIVALIPGEPIEIIAGVLYGTAGGMLTCLLGCLIGTIIIFYMVKLLGYSFVRTIISEEKMHKLKFMQNEKRLELVVFILFFIPGTPKDVLTYFVPLTSIKPIHFFLISTFARIPSVISSTFVGSALDKGNLAVSIGVFLATGVVGIAGIFLNDRVMKYFEKRKEEREKKKIER